MLCDPRDSHLSEKARTEGFFKIILCTLPAPRSHVRPDRNVFSRLDNTTIPSHFGGGGMHLHECVVARRVRKDQRWNAGVGACGGNPGSNARVWRSLDVHQHPDAEPAERGQHDTTSEEDCRDGRSGEVWQRGVREDQPPPETPVRRVEIISAPRGLLGSGHCDRALLHRYPLSLGTPNITQYEPGQARRLTLETRVLNGRASGG
jgi:hypothetical protein